MKVALFGATGNIGKVIACEALSRGHCVTGLVRYPERGDFAHPSFTLRKTNILESDRVVTEVSGHDVVVTAYAPEFENPGTLVEAANTLIKGLQAAGVSRLLIVGGAGSLEVAPGLQLADSPQFPPAWRPIAHAHRDALAVYRENQTLNWTYFSPAAMICPGSRTGEYRIGGDLLMVDDQGNSAISNEDFAMALVNEIEMPRFIRQRITVAY